MTTQPTKVQPPNLQRMRYAVRGVLVLGMAASVAANVLHADPNPISKVIAAWPPIALLLAIELVIHVPVHRLAVTRLRRGGTLLIAGIAAYVSYWHMAGVAERYGETGWSVYLLPLSVDGLIAIASICLVELSGRLRAESAKSVPKVAPQPEPGMSVNLNSGRPDVRKPQIPKHGGGGNSAKAIAPASAVEGIRDGSDRPQTVAAAVRSAWDELGDNPEAIQAKVGTTHPGMSETVRRNINRIRNARTNGHVHA